MRCNADAAHRVFVLEYFVEQFIERVDILDKAFLAGVRRKTAESGVRIKHRQQGEADSRCCRSGNNALGHFGPVRIRFALFVMVQIVKLGNAGITGFEHLDIELRCNCLVVFRRDALQKPVHQLPPGPKIIAARPGALGETRHGALKCV